MRDPSDKWRWRRSKEEKSNSKWKDEMTCVELQLNRTPWGGHRILHQANRISKWRAKKCQMRNKRELTLNRQAKKCHLEFMFLMCHTLELLEEMHGPSLGNSLIHWDPKCRDSRVKLETSFQQNLIQKSTEYSLMCIYFQPFWFS